MNIAINHKSTTSIICGLKVNASIPVNLNEPEDARRLRTLISGHIKKKYPLRVFSTEVIEDVLTITRGADLISE
jgi:hypothetical protein